MPLIPLDKNSDEASLTDWSGNQKEMRRLNSQLHQETSMKKMLLVDDNDRYAKMLTEYFANYGYEAERVYSATEGIEAYDQKDQDYYDLVVTDITMESQLAGLRLIKHLHKKSYPGSVVVASTGFDVPPGLTVSRIYFSMRSVDYLIPKSTVRSNALEFYPVKLFTAPLKEFPGTQGQSKR